MAQVIDFNLNGEEYLELGERCIESGNAEGAITNFKKALELNERLFMASINLATLYAGLGAHQISNKILYKALVLKPDLDSEGRIFYQLANNFLELGELEVVSYYMRYFSDDFDSEAFETKNPEEENFHVAYPRGDDYYEMLIERAYRAVREKDFETALQCAREVDPRSRVADAANHVILVCYMMKNDIDRVIDEARYMLEKSDSLAVRCTLATAFMMEEKLESADSVVCGILEKDYQRVEDILLLLPLLVNLNMHSEVVKYTKRVLESLNLQPNTMMWLSQGLYNLGQKKEAVKIMNRIKVIYGEYSPAEFYLDLYKTEPESVEYNMNLPYAERIRRYKRIEYFVKLDKVDFEKALKNDKELTSLIRWSFIDGNEKIKLMVLDRLDFCQTAWVKDFYRDILISPNLSFEIMPRVLYSLLNHGFTLDVEIVAQDRFKDVSLCLPDAFYCLPVVFHDAVSYAICDIIFTDEDPTTYIERLRKIVNSLVNIGADGRALWRDKNVEKIARLRSVRTTVGVLLTKVYEDDPNPKEDNMQRYELSERTFDKYYRIIFGDENNDRQE